VLYTVISQDTFMPTTINTSFIPPETFNIWTRKNATNVDDRKCPVPDPVWLKGLVATGWQLQMNDIVIQAGRHFSDKVNMNAFGPNTTRRQAATAIAWTIISMVSPYVDGNQLFVVDPNDSDIKRLCSEVFGVGMALELLRSVGIVDGRTIRKLGETFDYDAFGPNGGERINIEAKGTFENAATSEHRKSIANKITNEITNYDLPRGYNRAIGIIASLWTTGKVRKFDVEICDPERKPEDHFREAVREVIRFYARRFDEAVAIERGTETLFAIAEDEHLFDESAPTILGKLGRDRRKPIADLYHNRLAIRRQGVVQEFWGRLWEPRKLPIPLTLETDLKTGKRSAFMGVDSAIFRLIQQRDFHKLLSYRTNDKGLWYAKGATYAAVFNIDSYGVARGLIEGDLPMEVDAV
jgi:hypothetical protein